MAHSDCETGKLLLITELAPAAHTIPRRFPVVLLPTRSAMDCFQGKHRFGS
jgi:hypothetical protein